MHLPAEFSRKTQSEFKSIHLLTQFRRPSSPHIHQKAKLIAGAIEMLTVHAGPRTSIGFWIPGGVSLVRQAGLELSEKDDESCHEGHG